VRRAVFYLFYDPQGQVDDYVTHVLTGLRSHAEHIFVVSNGTLDDVARGRLEGCADEVWVRDNVGLDVWAYKEAMERVGPDVLAGFDEVVLMNSTFFGPVGSFTPLFARMDAQTDIDFWGVTEHGPSAHHPFDKTVPLGAHLQSHWLSVRRPMLVSDAWREYWDTMPMITSYDESVIQHESRFTAFFEERGFRSVAAFPASDYDTTHPVMNNIAQMMRDGCPIVKRRTFFHVPTYNEHFAIDGRMILREMEQRGYPLDMVYRNLARTARPRAMVTNLGLLEVLPEVDLGYDRSRPLAVVAVTHIFYPDMTDEILDRLDFLPTGYDLVVTTADEAKREEIQAVLDRRGRAGEIRVVKSNRGRDISAFFVDCRDVIESDDYDIVVKLHSKKNLQDSRNIAELFKRHLFENLLSSPGYAANVLRLFQQHPSLGMVFPPVYHIGYPTLGHAWYHNKPLAMREAERLGFPMPFDENTPLSAYGSMFIARPETLRALTSAGYTHDDFPDESGYGDGALTHVVERLASYAVLSTGHHIREVMNADLAALNYSYLEYRAIVVGALLPAYPLQQIKKIKQLKRFRAKKLRADARPAPGPDAAPDTAASGRGLLSRWRRGEPDG